MSEKLKLEKQTAKLDEMKAEALSKLEGLAKFQIMAISKKKMSDLLTVEEILQ
jgi:hypothetical protein